MTLTPQDEARLTAKALQEYREAMIYSRDIMQLTWEKLSDLSRQTSASALPEVIHGFDMVIGKLGERAKELEEIGRKADVGAAGDERAGAATREDAGEVASAAERSTPQSAKPAAPAEEDGVWVRLLDFQRETRIAPRDIVGEPAIYEIWLRLDPSRDYNRYRLVRANYLEALREALKQERNHITELESQLQAKEGGK